MKGLMLKGIKDLELRSDIPDPRPKKNEVLIKIKYCGICGSDLEAYEYGKVLTPLVLGHEFSGEIVEVGNQVEGWEVGDRVTAYPGEFCGKCVFCSKGEENRCNKFLKGLGITIDGALAEYLNWPARLLCKLPERVSFEEGALVEPLSVGYHGVVNSGIQPTDSVIVIGAGTIGLSTIQALKLHQIQTIYVIEPNKYNLDLALEMGAEEISRPSRINNVGPDYIFDCAGFPETYKKDIQIIRYGGTVILLGVHFEAVPIAFLQFIAKEVTMKGSFGYSFNEFKQVLKNLAEKRIRTDLILSKKIRLESAIEEGFLELLGPKKQAAKILVEI